MAVSVFTVSNARGQSPTANRDVGVYCLRDHRTQAVRIFAGKIMPSGRLKFGLTQWDANGRNIGVFGVAAGRRPGWRYASGLSAPSPDDRCRLDILVRGDGTLRVRADPVAACHDEGGQGAEIGVIEFPSSAYEGPVRSELQDEETFFNKTGRC